MVLSGRISEEKLLREATVVDEKETINYGPRRHGRYYRYLCGSQLAFFLLSLLTFLSSSFFRDPGQRCSCGDYMPMYSPALEALRNTGYLHRFDGSFATGNAFKGTPSPDIDAAWANITYQDGGVINISKETLHAVNASAEFSVELAPEIGGGYMASVEALHQLHCLNMLRQATYEDYYQDKAEPWQDSRQTLRYHLGSYIAHLYEMVTMLTVK
ncbi:MAG: hypothetical protein Q9195_004183 [Heterodermia aff. obscurata]